MKNKRYELVKDFNYALKQCGFEMVHSEIGPNGIERVFINNKIFKKYQVTIVTNNEKATVKCIYKENYKMRVFKEYFDFSIIEKEEITSPFFPILIESFIEVIGEYLEENMIL